MYGLEQIKRYGIGALLKPNLDMRKMFTTNTTITTTNERNLIATYRDLLRKRVSNGRCKKQAIQGL